jgi:hypothetical protein
MKIIVFTLISLLSAGHHPFYVTVTEIEYSSKNKELGISIKTFPDDLEETIRLNSGKKIDLSIKNNPQINQLVTTYLQQHLTIEINKNKKQLNFLGYEIDKEAVWIYFNIPKINSIKELKVISDVMYEYKSEQTNIVHVNVNGSQKSYKLNAPDKVIIVNN